MALITINNPATRYRYFNLFWLSLLLITPIILWILPADFFDNGKSICPSKVFFDVECYGCGITRAVMHMHHFDWREAFFYNMLVVVVYPACVIVWFLWVKAAIKRYKIQFKKSVS